MPDISLQAFRAAFTTFGITGIVALSLLLSGFFLSRYVLLKWMDNKFQQALEHFKTQAKAAVEKQKHELQKKLEDKKYEINSRFDRTTRINQLEFQMLPDLWSQLNDAIVKTQELSGLRSYPEVSQLSDEKLKRHMLRLNFIENQIETVMESVDKSKSYRIIIDAIDHSEAMTAFNQFAMTTRKSAIFIQPDFFAFFRESECTLKSNLIEYDMNRQGFYPTRMFEHRQKLSDASGNNLQRLEQKIRDRLWNSLVPEI